MSSLKQKFSSIFGFEKPVVYKNYTHAELKVIVIKARVSLETRYQRQVQNIKAGDSMLVHKKESPGDTYRILQEIGRNVIEVESMRIYAELLKKIEDCSARIISTNGDFSYLKQELPWFKCLLWYHKTQKLECLNELHVFCFNFFKGIDMTAEVTPNCEIFQLYGIIKFLDPSCILPLNILLPTIRQYLTTSIDDKILEQVINYDKQEVKKWLGYHPIENERTFLKESPPKLEKVERNENMNSKALQQNNEEESEYFKWLHKLEAESKVKSSQNDLPKTPLVTFPEKNPEIKNEIIPEPEPVKAVTQSKTGSFMSRLMQSSIKKVDNHQVEILSDEIAAQTKKETENIRTHAIEEEGKIEDMGDSENELFEQFEARMKKEDENKKVKEAEAPEEVLFEEISSSKYEPIFQQIECSKNIVEDNLIFMNEMKEKENEGEHEKFDDEGDSLRFIKEELAEKKKGKKKPYMVSIYARDEWMEKVKK